MTSFASTRVFSTKTPSTTPRPWSSLTSVVAVRRPERAVGLLRLRSGRRSTWRSSSVRVLPARPLRRTCGRALQLVDVELAHLHHRGHHALRLLLVRVGQELGQAARDDLPGEAEAVLQPAARAVLAALAELLPVVVDLVLAVEVDRERDGLVELEVGAAVQRDHALAVELEADGHREALLTRPGRAVARDVEDLRVREDGRVELGCGLALGVEPE